MYASACLVRGRKRLIEIKGVLILTNQITAVLLFRTKILRTFHVSMILFDHASIRVSPDQIVICPTCESVNVCVTMTGTILWASIRQSHQPPGTTLASTCARSAMGRVWTPCRSTRSGDFCNARFSFFYCMMILLLYVTCGSYLVFRITSLVRYCYYFAVDKHPAAPSGTEVPRW